MKKILAYLKTFTFIAITFFVYRFAVHVNNERPIKKIEIDFVDSQQHFITPEMVNNLLIQKNGPILNQRKSLINLQKLETIIQKHPLVAKAEVSVDLFGNLQIAVYQRKPIARVFEGNYSYYLDNEGKKMPLSTVSTARVVLIDNEYRNIKFKEVYPLVQTIVSDSFFKEMVVAITKKKNESYVLKTRYHEQELELGNLNHLKEKLRKAEVFYNYIKKDTVAQHFKNINMQYHNQVVCSK